MEKMGIIKGALPYIRKFKDKVFVVKLGGEVVKNFSSLDSLAEDISLLHHVGINVVVVHGGGTQADELLEKIGIKPKYVKGRRITDTKTFQIIKMVYGGINLEITAAVRKHGTKVIGLSGIDGNLIKAKRRIAKIDFGHVGDIVSVDLNPINLLLENDYVPVICSIGSDDSGNIYNINADTVAAEIARNLEAEKLIVMTDVPGLLDNPGDKNSIISYVDIADLKKMLSEDRIKEGMIPKVENCIYAMQNGVHTTHIIDGTKRYSLLQEVFTNEGSGTMIVKNKKETI